MFRGWWRARIADARPVRSQVLSHASGVSRSVPNERCCIFAHFDPDGIVADYVFDYLRQVRDLGADIVFVSTSLSLRDDDISLLRSMCSDIIRRRNITADFGSWKLGIAILGDDIANYGQLILANDSVYGPFTGLAPLFAEMEGREIDLWGLTENFDHGRHVQSYFLVFERAALQSKFFEVFWRSLRNETDKHRMILACEVGLTRMAQARGLKVGCWISADDIGTERNPTLFAWERLIEQRGFPFLKTEILKTNRFNSPNAARWRQVLAKFPAYDPEPIAAHLRRVGSAVEP